MYLKRPSTIRGEGKKKETDCVRRVNAALVIELGKFNPFVTSRHNFLLITSTRPPFPTTNRKSSSRGEEETCTSSVCFLLLHKSKTCLAIIGIRLTGVPLKTKRSFALLRLSRCFTSFLHESEQIVEKFFAFWFIGQFVELNKRNRSIDFSRRSPAVFFARI